MAQMQQDTETADKIVLGRITGVYGVKGWVKVFSYTEPMEAIVDYSPWYLRPARSSASRNSAPWTAVKLKAGKRHAKTVIAKLEHCNDRDEAQAYIGSEIGIEPDQLEPLSDKDEYYWRDLIGLRVINQQGIELGVVTKILETGANDVLVVTEQVAAQSETDATAENTASKEHLVPWTMQQAIIAVDLQQGIIEVDWDVDF
jgi:16S rRNA processing protein RimM